MDTTPPQEPHVRAILSFSYPEGADAQKLEGLGYEVFGYPLWKTLPSGRRLKDLTI